MRPASSRVVLWMSVLSLLAAFFAVESFAFGQSSSASKHKLSHEAVPQASVEATLAPTPKGVRPLVTTETWTGGGGSGDTKWSDASNWNNGAITIGENIMINTTTAATQEDNSPTIGTLTLSNAGDSVTLLNNTVLTVDGNITNNGTITLDATGNATELDIGASLTLSGTGTLVLGTGNTNYILGTSGVTLTNASNITGVGNIGNGALVLANTGTINANVSGDTLVLQPDGSVASSNTGTLEATNGGTLELYGGSWTNTGGTISAAAGSTVNLVASVSITGGTLTTTGNGVIDDAAGQYAYLTNVTNKGTYNIINNAETVISGTITNNGTINLLPTGNTTALYVAAGGATLTGSGSVLMGTGATSYIDGANGATLTIDQGISGVGNLGNGELVLVNNSTINANISPTVSTAPLTLQPDGTITNSSTGVLEATNGGTLVLYGGSIANSGTIQAVGSDSSGNASTVVLENSVSITGGTLTTSGSGVIDDAAGQYAYLTNVTNKATYNILNNAETVIPGTITNDAHLTLLATGNTTALDIAAGGATLTGTGSVVMGTGSTNYIYGSSGATLTIDQGISGAGNIGDGSLILVNNNTINANVSGDTLILQPDGSAAAINNKILEATNGATLEFYGGSWTNTTGTITAANGSTVLLLASVSITGGTLSTTGTGVIDDGAGQNVYLTNVTNSGTYNILNNAATIVSGTITNTGTINLEAAGNTTELDLAANTTFKGKGDIILGSGATNYILGTGGVTLTNEQTIEGAGNVGDGSLKITNTDVIDANVNGGTLILQADGSVAASTNTKTLEATNGGILEFYGGKWTQTRAGTIAAATGSTVNLAAGVSITGGTLNTVGTGTINDVAGQTIYLTNLTNNGTYNILNNATTVISGTITNNGTINLLASGNATELDLAANTTITGTGAVVLGSGSTNYILGGSGVVLTNDSTIEGAGNIGDGALTITNNGTLDANVTGANLVIAPGNGGFTNYNGTTNTLTGGTYIANGGNLTFAGSATGITTLSANVIEENGGQIIDTNGNINALAGLTSITSSGSLTTDVNFTDHGAFSNAGSLTILKGTSFTVGSLSQISSGTLTAGTYVLDANLSLSGATQSITTNAANLTLAGGTIENANNTNALAALATNSGSLALANDATFTTKSNFSNTGTLPVGKGNTFTVNGTLAQVSGSTLASGTFVLGGNLTVASGVSITTNATSLTLEGGTIESGTSNALANLASNTGSLTLANSGNFTTGASKFTNTGALTINSGSTFTVTNTLGNLSSGTLSGGSYTIGGTLQMASSNGGIVNNAANLTLTGKTAKILDGTTNALAGFDNNTGSLTLAGSAVLTTAASNFSNSGTVDVANGSTLTIGGATNGYNQTAGKTTVDGTLTGAVNLTGGTIQGAGTLKGNVSVGGSGTTPTLHVGDSGLAGLLKITGTYTQLSTGTLNVAIGGLTSGTQYSKLTISGAASLSGNLTVNMINGFVPAVGKTFTILSAKSITGTFSTQYIVINSSEYFAVTYTATGVVLEVDSGTPPAGPDTSHAAAVVAVVKKDVKKDKTNVLTSDLRKRYSGEPSRLLTASAHAPRGTLAQRYPADTNLANRFDNTLANNLANRLDNNVRPPDNVYGLAIWRGPTARPVSLPKASVVGLHTAKNWASSTPIASPRMPLVGNWQGRTVPMLKALPSLMRAR